MVQETENEGNLTDLPAGIVWKSGDGHPVRRAARTWRSSLVVAKALTVSGSASELDRQSFAHEVGSIFKEPQSALSGRRLFTKWVSIARGWLKNVRKAASQKQSAEMQGTIWGC